MAARPRRAQAATPAVPDTAGALDDGVLAVLPGLLRDLAAAGVEELEVAVGDAKLFVRQRPGVVPVVSSQAAAAPQAAPAEEEAGLVSVDAPLSGVFYIASAPDAPPYVKEGDEVEAGQVVALVEAMKVFNEIHADVAGTVVRIVATAGQLVQSGQPLIKIRPHAGAAISEA